MVDDPLLNLDRIKDLLRKAYADLANGFERRLNAISTELANIGGPLEVPGKFLICSIVKALSVGSTTHSHP